MNNIVMRKADVTGEYQPLSADQLVATVTISTPPSNSGNVLFLGDDGTDVPWVPGEWHTFRSINLASVQIKGTPGDVVTFIGGTW